MESLRKPLLFSLVPLAVVACASCGPPPMPKGPPPEYEDPPTPSWLERPDAASAADAPPAAP